MGEFLDMGGYGLYVWSSYGICAVVLAALAASSIVGRNRKRRELDTLDGSRRRRSRNTRREHMA